MLHLIACDLHTFEIWKETLQQILAFRRELLGGLNHMRKRQDYWLKQNWTQVTHHHHHHLSSPLPPFFVSPRVWISLIWLHICRVIAQKMPSWTSKRSSIYVASSTSPSPNRIFRLTLMYAVCLLSFEKISFQFRIETHLKFFFPYESFQIADSQKRGYLDFPAFQHFVKLMKRRPDIQSLFQQFTFGRNLMSVEEFAQFMKQVQHVCHHYSSLTKEHQLAKISGRVFFFSPFFFCLYIFQSELSPSTIHAIYAKFLDDEDTENEKETEDANHEKQMTIEGFASFLQSADNSALHEKHTAVHQDMSLPLHDYFISTSHNVC